VNAVWHGLRAGSGEIVMTTDADCRVGPDWVRAMATPFADPDVVLALGSVTTRGPGEARGFRERFEAIDWLSLMLTSRSLARFGRTFASSANAQAYRRDAFERVGGFGLAARAPSGDEDLLAQRLGRLPDARAVFVDDPAAWVLTRPMPSWGALLRQRRRWASRYQHVDQYHPAFWSAIVLLGAQSAALAVALLALPFAPAAAPTVLALWGAKVAIEVLGAHVGLGRLGRADLRVRRWSAGRSSTPSSSRPPWSRRWSAPRPGARVRRGTGGGSGGRAGAAACASASACRSGRTPCGAM
jgi:hypothetical protein